jgi:hypothetical protein
MLVVLHQRSFLNLDPCLPISIFSRAPPPSFLPGTHVNGKTVS